MGKFKNSQVFIIIDDIDITTEMINYSTSRSKSEMPSKTSNLILKRILETTEPVQNVYASYVWYSVDEILPAWESLP
jgi:hypothetical protein